ncbi:MAG: alpha/beta hydrolase, partial [Patescibacteria group bacterium]|nr:alpha/beta hydrolase [Patescibacteria group bacterium]
MKATYHNVSLPLTRLHYLHCGQGEPLIMVPATISEINSWLPLAQFMGQRFSAYFFELPGHGQSTPFKQGFSSDLVAQSVEHWLNKLKINRFNLMGFSFGGILATKIMERVENRINKVILLAPCLSHKAVQLSKLRQIVLKIVAGLISLKPAQTPLIKLIHNPSTAALAVQVINKLGKVEITGRRKKDLKKRLLQLPVTTLDVLTKEISEILTCQFPAKTFTPSCFLGMSVNDPLINFQVTENILKRSFEELTVKKFYWHYHQP